MDDLLKANIISEKYIILIRGYVIPILSVIIITLAVVFIYIPSASGIISNYNLYTSDTTKTASVENKIKEYHTLANAQDDFSTRTNLLLQILPDDQKDANMINTVQTLAANDNIQISTAASSIPDKSALNGQVSLLPQTAISEIDFSGIGSAPNARKFFDDLNTLKPIVIIQSAAISGNLTNANGSQHISFVIDTFTLNANTLASTFILTTAFNTNIPLASIQAIK